MKYIRGLIGLVLSVLVLSSAADAVMIDFQRAAVPEDPQGITEDGYSAVIRSGMVVDGITFRWSNASVFNRNELTDSGDFTLADLYNDFLYTNGDAPIILTIEGLVYETAYDIRFYSSDRFDFDLWPTIVTNTFTPLTGSGPTLNVTFDRRIDPTSNSQHSAFGTYISDTTGKLIFEITSAPDIDGRFLTRINGAELNVTNPVPELATMLLLGTGLIGLAGGARRRRKK